MQSLIRGKFFYLPVISGYRLVEHNPRAWRYQLLARTAVRMPKVVSRASDYEPLEDAVVVYLRNGELVELE